MGRLPDAAGFSELVVATIDGIPIRVSDLGRAEDGTAERRTAARLDGVPTVVLEVIRQSGREHGRRDRRREGRRSNACRSELPPGRPAPRHPRPVPLHPRGAPRDQRPPHRGHDPREPRRARVHAELARDDHRVRRDPDVGDRDVRGDVVARTSRSTA